jgi:alkylation response protein AidB-like acyl-CoA dehydrogenase
MYHRVFRYVKNKLPRISDTEMIALKSGTVSIDRDILSGKINFPQKKTHIYKFPQDRLINLLEKYDNSKIYPNDNDNYWINHLANNKFFSFLINENYGGIKLSVNELSSVLTKIASVSPALGVVAMVPNSLGPGELITLYGTENQKNKYLPKLARGEYIPCFGLTGPNNGSDATGSIDTGVVFKENNKLKVKVNLNKRYITLAPVANLMGIAFDLKDPDNLLGKSGITVALVERDHLNLIQETHHNPLDVGFPNGTIKGEIVISLDQIIGGEENVGNGWKMLMECLSAGRGVSLPATANASSKVASFGMYHYIKTREQFKLTLSEMEGIQEKFLNMMYHTWIIQSSIEMTNDILDEGHSPAVISAIMKQQTTERGRIVLNEAIDIHAGSAICIGYSNFLEKYYKSIPIGITVEGSNTLTRSLIIFAQGLNKSHPFIFPILESILNDDLKSFKTNFNNIIKHGLKLYFSCIDKNKGLEQEVIRYATLTNFVALKAGALKKEQMLSGDMADMFSNLYLAISVRYYQEHYKTSALFSNYVIERLLNENRVIMKRVVNNLGPERYLLKPILVEPTQISYEKNRNIFNEIMNNKNIISEVEKNIYIKNDSILNDLQQYTQQFDKKLYNKIINVGEFKNDKDKIEN